MLWAQGNTPVAMDARGRLFFLTQQPIGDEKTDLVFGDRILVIGGKVFGDVHAGRAVHAIAAVGAGDGQRRTIGGISLF